MVFTIRLGVVVVPVVYPKSPNFKNDSEEITFNFLKDYLPEDSVCYFNYIAKSKESDFCFILPNKAVFIVEVKGWEAVQIVRIDDNDTIVYRDRNNDEKSWGSPFKQVRSYQFELKGEIDRRFNRKPLIVSMVCYPKISIKDFERKGLGVISKEQLTILEDDLKDKETFINKINNAYNFLKSDINHEELTIEVFNEIRSIYESDKQIEDVAAEEAINMKDIELVEVYPIREKRQYSLLKYIGASNTEEEIIDLSKSLISQWKNGTKIIIISKEQNLINKIKLSLESSLGQLVNHKDFKIRDDNGKLKNCIFNFEFHRTSIEVPEDFEVVNGDFSKVEKYLDEIDNKSSFNFKQYKIEHADINDNIVVKAGAGSGKTYSMISRITYLIFKKKYDSRTIADAIFLITFTNEAAKNMKDRLQKYLLNYYLLTRDYEFFKMIESIEDMKISTIHSLIKKIISKYSVKLGMGREISITQGTYDKNTEINTQLDKYVASKFKNNEEATSKLRFTMYNLFKRLVLFLDKLEQKNIDLRDSNINFGNSSWNEHNELIKFVLKESQKQLIIKADDHNQVRLSNLIIKINELISNYGQELKEESYPIDYLFVDEFQDTDDIQIEIMKKFFSIFDFKFFVVGDVKQCIYRFRGAEHKAFDKLVDNEKWPDYYLTKNYRTDSRLLDLFHPIFSVWGAKGFIDYDENSRLQGTKTLNSIEDEFFKVIEFKGEEQRAKELVNVINIEKSRLSDNGKIAILVRDNNQIELVRNICRQAGIAVDTEGCGDLYQIRPAIDLYKLILALQNNKDVKFLYNLYNTCYVKAKIPKHFLYKNRKSTKFLYDSFMVNCPISDWKTHLKNLRIEPVMKVLRTIINQTEPWENYSNKGFNEKERFQRKSYYKRNLEQLIEIMVESFNNDYLTINKIEQYLSIMILTRKNQESRESFNLSESINNVICTTVHKSKGLEYETVIMPFCDKNIDGSSSKSPVDIITRGKDVGYSIQVDETLNPDNKFKRISNKFYSDESKSESNYKMNEETRILYVAMTRAIKNFIWFKNTVSKFDKSWQKLIEWGIK